MPGMNEVIKACNTADWGKHGRRWNRYNELKLSWTREIQVFANQRNLAPIATKCFTFVFAEKARQRDPDNFISGGMKLIFDSLVTCKLMPNDGWKYVEDIKTYWHVDAEAPGVMLIMTRVPITTFEQAFSIYSTEERGTI